MATDNPTDPNAALANASQLLKAAEVQALKDLKSGLDNLETVCAQIDALPMTEAQSNAKRIAADIRQHYAYRRTSELPQLILKA